MSQSFTISRRHAMMSAAAVGLVPLPALAEGHGDGDAQGAPDKGESLHDLMHVLSGRFRSLRKIAGKPESATETQTLLHDMQVFAVRAKALQPQQVTELAGDQKAEKMRRYQLKMIILVEKLLETERAVIEGRFSDADKLVKEVYNVQRDGHLEFRIDD